MAHEKYDHIPPGYYFRPTEQELIYLLKQHAGGQNLETDQVVEKILYGKNATPWDVFSDDNDVHWQILEDYSSSNCKKPAASKTFAYVLVKLNKVSAKRTLRVAGCGTWDGQSAGRPIRNDSGEIIGRMKMLNFVLNHGCSPEEKAAGMRNGYWIMHEYSLENDDAADYVICRIIRDDSKNTKEKVSTISKRRRD